MMLLFLLHDLWYLQDFDLTGGSDKFQASVKQRIIVQVIFQYIF